MHPFRVLQAAVPASALHVDVLDPRTSANRPGPLQITHEFPQGTFGLLSATDMKAYWGHHEPSEADEADYKWSAYLVQVSAAQPPARPELAFWITTEHRPKSVQC